MQVVPVGHEPPGHESRSAGRTASSDAGSEEASATGVLLALGQIVPVAGGEPTEQHSSFLSPSSVTLSAFTPLSHLLINRRTYEGKRRERTWDETVKVENDAAPPCRPCFVVFFLPRFLHLSSLTSHSAT